MQPEDHGSEGHFGCGRVQRGLAGGGDESVCGWQGESGRRGEGEDFLFIAFYESGAAACQVLHGEAGGIPGG